MNTFDELCRELQVASDLEQKYKERRSELERMIAEKYVADPPQSGTVRVHPEGAAMQADIKFTGRLAGEQDMLKGLPPYVRAEVFVPKLSVSKTGINNAMKALEAEAAASAAGKRRLTLFQKALEKFKFVSYKPSVKVYEVE